MLADMLNSVYRLPYLVLRPRPVPVEVSGSTEMFAAFRVALEGACFRDGEAVWDCVAEALCFSSSSPMLALRKETGIRLTRRSMRARRSLACRAYWARSLRARSVTNESVMVLL